MIAKVSKEYQSIIVIVLGCLVWYFISKNIIFVYLAVWIGSASILSKFIAFKIHWLWMKLAWILSMIVPKFVLTALFFIILFPISILSKIFGRKDPLLLKQPIDSSFITQERNYIKSDFDNMW